MNIDSINSIIDVIRQGVLAIGIDAGTHKQGVVCLARKIDGTLTVSNYSFRTHPYSATPFPVTPRSQFELLLSDRISDPMISQVLAFIELPVKRHRKDPNRPAMEKKWRKWLSEFPKVRTVEVRIEHTYNCVGTERHQLAKLLSLETELFLEEDTNDALATLLTGLRLECGQLR